jgi:hypothetical protein
VTKPVVDTVATLGAVVAQVIARPVRGAPPASRGVAVSCPVCPTVRLSVVGDIATEATGTGATAVTVIALVPVRPSLVAVIVADPALCAVTRPLPETVATADALVAQVTMRPVSAVPPASRGVAVTWPVWPTVRPSVVGAIPTEATGTGGGGGAAVTVIVARPERPPLEAVIVADPAATAVTSPVSETAAMDAAELVQVGVRSAIG